MACRRVIKKKNNGPINRCRSDTFFVLLDRDYELANGPSFIATSYRRRRKPYRKRRNWKLGLETVRSPGVNGRRRAQRRITTGALNRTETNFSRARKTRLTQKQARIQGGRRVHEPLPEVMFRRWIRLMYSVATDTKMKSQLCRIQRKKNCKTRHISGYHL